MQAVMHKSSFKMKYKLEDKITNWMHLNHSPVINVQRNYDKYSLNISVKDSNVDVFTLNIITQTNLKELLSVVWLIPHISYHSQIITDFMGENDWILVNSSQSGKYLSIYLFYITYSCFLQIHTFFLNI